MGQICGGQSRTERFSGEVSRIWLVNRRTGEFITGELFSDFIAEKEKERREQQIAKEARERAARLAAEEAAKRRQEEAIKAAKELADAMFEYRAAAQAELRKYFFRVDIPRLKLSDSRGTYMSNPDDGLVIDPSSGRVDLEFSFRTREGVMNSYRDSLSLAIDSVTVDFKDPSVPDFVRILWPLDSNTLGQ